MMIKMKFYAILKGSKTGIFTDWEEAKNYVIGFRGAVYKSFSTRYEAEKFLKNEFLLKNVS